MMPEKIEALEAELRIVRQSRLRLYSLHENAVEYGRDVTAKSIRRGIRLTDRREKKLERAIQKERRKVK